MKIWKMKPNQTKELKLLEVRGALPDNRKEMLMRMFNQMVKTKTRKERRSKMKEMMIIFLVKVVEKMTKSTLQGAICLTKS